MLYVDSYYQYSAKIKHEENGDKAFSWVFDASPSSVGKVAVFGVLDGVSNTDSAALSSALAEKEIRKTLAPLFLDIEALCDMEEADRMQYFFSLLRKAILAADLLLWNYPGLYACTASIAIAFDEYVYVANVGDSPVYLADNFTRSLTEIYTCQNEAGYMVRQGVLTKEEALTSKTKNYLLKAVGGKKSRLTEIDISTHKALLPQDGILILGSDGSLGVFNEDKLKDIIFSNYTDMKELCEDVYNQVLCENGGDDSTLVVSHIRIGY